MLLERIENNLKIIEKNINKENFIYAFLEAYEQPKATINRLKKGDYNLSKNDYIMSLIVEKDKMISSLRNTNINLAQMVFDFSDKLLETNNKINLEISKSIKSEDEELKRLISSNVNFACSSHFPGIFANMGFQAEMTIATRTASKSCTKRRAVQPPMFFLELISLAITGIMEPWPE